MSQSRIQRGKLAFSVESRILRELGERLVKQPEVAVVELIKNAYDADASECIVEYDARADLVVEDDGHGMTFDEFATRWMRIGTGAKASNALSEKYSRHITGEKGIGRFAVRFLGRALLLETVADDPVRGLRTLLTADFDWPDFDRKEDLGKVEVPYQLFEVDASTPTGTKLIVRRLRTVASQLDLNAVRTGSIGMLSPVRSLFRERTGDDVNTVDDASDPGFVLDVRTGDVDPDSGDVAAQILEAFVLRAQVILRGSKADLRVFRRGFRSPHLKIVDTYANQIGNLDADIRFFPRRQGTFTGLPVDGRRAQSWVTENHGVAVFDRNFRVPPYGHPSDDWLQLQADAARNRRDPRSRLARKHFAMDASVRAAPGQNWMLRLPQSAQLVGIVRVRGRRTEELDAAHGEEGLIASADREGFIENESFKDLRDLVRGAVEAIAFADRELQLKEEETERRRQEVEVQAQTQAAIAEVRANPDIADADKARIVSMLTQTARMASGQQETARDRERQLEVMSLLGVVAGFMTHEFGAALKELEETHSNLVELTCRMPKYEQAAKTFAGHIERLREFVTYASGYVQGARSTPKKPYHVRPRLRQVKRVFGEYADQRNIDVEITAGRDLMAPRVPVSLYNGVALNLYSNALKAVTAKTSAQRGRIAFRAWNDGRWHNLEVSDTGVGISEVLYERVFDAFVTTTESHGDPLGSGMGLGLALVRKGVEAFGGKVELTAPPAHFATCVRVRIPMDPTEDRT